MPSERAVRSARRKDEPLQGRVVGNEQSFAVDREPVQRHHQCGHCAINGLRSRAAIMDGEGRADRRHFAAR